VQVQFIMLFFFLDVPASQNASSSSVSVFLHLPVPFNQVRAQRFHAEFHNRLIPCDSRHSPFSDGVRLQDCLPRARIPACECQLLNLRCVVLNFPAAFRYVSPTSREWSIGAHAKDGGDGEVEQLFLDYMIFGRKHCHGGRGRPRN
jgi:hypothetical protein